MSYLGVRGPHVGIAYLLKALRCLVHERQCTDVQFTLIGGGDLQPQMVRLSQELGLSDCVNFPGRIPDADVMAILSTADVCVAPDPKDLLNDVCTMNKIIEYMAMGKPIVAFDLREARVSAGEAALYARPNDPVDFADKILELLSQPERRQEMGALGRQRFETVLAWEHQRINLLALYKGLFEDGTNTG